jgi:putative ABC transport system permease protein
MPGFAQDVRYALRALRKNPGFTAVAVLTLALGIGANTAAFSVLNAVILRPLPYQSPDRLTLLWTEIPTQALREGRSAFGDVEQWRARSRSFADMAVLDPVRLTLTGESGSEQVTVGRVSPNFFPLLGVQPSFGRNFSTQEADERQRVVVISHNFWQTRFGGAPEALGRTIVLDRMPSRIVGILPEDVLQGDADIWEPHTLFANWDALRAARGAGSWMVYARLRPGVTLAQAQAEMSAIARRLDEERSAANSQGISVVPMSLYVTGSTTRVALWMLTGAVSLVLLMAIANVAGLSLARSSGREREIAVRAALGASRGHIARQLLIESLTLGLVSGAAGLLVALACVRLMLSLRPGDLPRLDEVSLDPAAFGWALTMALLSGVLIGLAPAMTATRRDLKLAFQDGGRGASGGAAARRVRRVLVAAEFALAIVLLVGAGLLTRSLLNLHGVEPGFRVERVLALQLASPTGPNVSQRMDYFNRVLEQARAVGGVESAAIASEMFIGGNPEQNVSVDGSTTAAPERVRLRRDEISPRFFDTISSPLIRGRDFSMADDAHAPRVAIVNEAMARRLWPGQDALGRRFKFGPRDAAGDWFTVIGIMRDMRRQGLEHEPIPQMFESLAQNPSRLVTLLVRTTTDPRSMMATVQSAVRGVDKAVPVYGVTTLEERLDGFSAQRRFQTSLLIAFSLIALTLAAVGIYGLIRYSVATRLREISIRIAVGAERTDILLMIVREGMTLSLMGLVLGLAGAAALGRLLSTLVFGVTPTDPVTFSVVSLLLLIVAVVACYLPARRASRVNPLMALKYE